MVIHTLSQNKNNKIIIVAVPADRSPLLRMRGANRCTAIAEYFRSKGKISFNNGFIDQVAHAKREIGLSLGEQPTSKGYTPSVISMVPALIERAGSGNITEGKYNSFYTF